MKRFIIEREISGASNLSQAELAVANRTEAAAFAGRLGLDEQ